MFKKPTRAIKKHYCELCKGVIQKKEIYTYISIPIWEMEFNDKFLNYRLHKECHDIFESNETLYLSIDGGYSFKDQILDSLDCFDERIFPCEKQLCFKLWKRDEDK